jgi:hypothetical protein
LEVKSLSFVEGLIKKMGKFITNVCHLIVDHLFGISLLITIFTRIFWIKIPFFISDEAFLLTIGGQISIKGGIYAKDFVDTRGPGSYYITAIHSIIFGYGNILAYRIIGIFVQLIILLLILRLGRQLFDDSRAKLSCLFYAVFSYGYLIHDSVAFNVEFMALPFLLGSAILFYEGLKRFQKDSPTLSNWVRLFFSGFLVALTFAIKQVIAGNLAVYLILLGLSCRRNDFKWPVAMRAILLLGLGFLSGVLVSFGPSLITVGWKTTFYWLAMFGFMHYNPHITTKIISLGQRVLLMFLAQPLLWTMNFLWIGLFIRLYRHRNEGEQQSLLFLLLMLVMQWVGAMIGGQVVGHTMMPAIAFMSIIAADMIMHISEGLSHINSNSRMNFRMYLVAAIFLIGLLPPILDYSVFPEGVRTPEFSVGAFFQEKLRQKKDPITATVAFIRDNSSRKDHIFVLGRLYEIYPLSQRLPASIALGLNWFQNRESDLVLQEYYNTILKTLGENQAKIIILPCPEYGGIDLEDNAWKEVNELLNLKYFKPIRFAWHDRLKFLRGKNMSTEPDKEWIDVYILKNS